MQPVSAIGVDGCRDGWIAAISTPGQSIRWRFHTSIQELIYASPSNAVILVDMIIGLPDQSNPTRACDQLARQVLRPHGSRVFSAPPREALTAPNYKAACAAARTATGKAISKQCWYLFPKIRELDSISDTRIRESHPELVFSRLNEGTPVAASKKTLAGQNTRLRLLRDALPSSIDAFLCKRTSSYPQSTLLQTIASTRLLCAPQPARPTRCDVYRRIDNKPQSGIN